MNATQHPQLLQHRKCNHRSWFGNGKSAVRLTHGSGTVWIEPDRVVHSILKTLLTAQIPFCGFDGNVSEEKLDLFELTASLMAQSDTCPAQVMRGEPCQTAADGSLLYDGPDHFRREAVSRHSPRLVDGSKQRA